MKNSLFTVLFFIGISSVYANESKVPASLNNGEYGTYIAQENYRVLGVNVATDDFKTIQSKLGDSELYKVEHTSNHLCYANNHHQIEFAISSLGYGYKIMHKSKAPSKCTVISADIANGYGLKIGMKKSQIINLLGTPSKVQDTKLSYFYWVQEKPSAKKLNQLHSNTTDSDLKDMWLDVYSHLEITFKNDVVDSFSVFTTNTY